MDVTTRLQVRVAGLFLLLWCVLMFVDLVALDGGPMSAQRIFAHFGLLAIGFKGNLVAGIRYQLNATMWGTKPLAHPWRIAVMGLLIVTALLLAADGFGAATPEVTTIIPWVWLAGTALLFAGVVWQPLARRSDLGPPQRYLYDVPSDVLVVVATAYAAMSGISAVGFAWDAPSTVHLWTIGYLVTMVTAILLQMLPRFATVAPPRVSGYVIAVAAILAPAFIVWGQYGARPDVLVWGAILEGVVWVLLLGLITFTYVKRRNPQPFAPAVAAALVFALAGAALGAGMSRGDVGFQELPLHLMVKFIGFLGTMVVGMGQVMLGLGHVRMGKKIVRMQRMRVGLWLVLFTAWAGSHYFADPPRELDVVPIVLMGAVGLMLVDRMRRLLPVHLSPPKGPRGVEGTA